jgi:plastocyanin
MGKGRLASILLATALAACTTEGPAYAPPPTDVATVVTMTNWLRFSPDQTVLHTGETVEWRNRSWWTHTVTFEPLLADEPGEVTLPRGAQPFSSGPILPGQVYHHTFRVAGTYRYICQPHDWFGMSGTVVVQP